jgi:hypothetical protein
MRRDFLGMEGSGGTTLQPGRDENSWWMGWLSRNTMPPRAVADEQGRGTVVQMSLVVLELELLRVEFLYLF